MKGDEWVVGVVFDEISMYDMTRRRMFLGAIRRCFGYSLSSVLMDKLLFFYLYTI